MYIEKRRLKKLNKEESERDQESDEELNEDPREESKENQSNLKEKDKLEGSHLSINDFIDSKSEKGILYSSAPNKTKRKELVKSIKKEPKPLNVDQEIWFSESFRYKEEVSQILNKKHIYTILKALSSIYYAGIILSICFCVIFSGGAIGILLAFILSIFCFSKFNSQILKYLNILMIILFLEQYLVALSNVSPKNSPIVLPYPFSINEGQTVYWGIPWYIKQINLIEMDSKWAYFSGVLISLKSLRILWAYGITIIMITVYFANFNLSIINNEFEYSNSK